MVDATIAATRETVGTWRLATLEIARPSAKISHLRGGVAAPILVRRDVSTPQGGIIVPEVLSSATGRAVPITARADGQVPALSGARKKEIRDGRALPLASGAVVAERQEVMVPSLRNRLASGVVEATPTAASKFLPTSAITFATLATCPSGPFPATLEKLAVIL